MTTTSPIALVLNRLEGVKKAAGGYMALCPGHDDREPSLGVAEGDDGRVLLRCHAGCELEAVLAGAKLEAVDLFPAPASNGHRAGDDIVSIYSYTDETGVELFQVVRKTGKKFLQRRADGMGGWEWTIKGTRRVLYNLPDVIEAVAAGVVVYIAEGEKDCEALGRAGEVATCNPGGAGKWDPGYAEVLQGGHVVIVVDQDPPGIKHAGDVEASLVGVAASVRVVAPAAGKDAADHLEAGYAIDAFVPDGARVGDLGGEAPGGFFVDWADFWAQDRRDADWLYEDVLARGRGHSLFAGHKIGKSLIMLALVVELVAQGHVVIYLDYEIQSWQGRIALILEGMVECARVLRPKGVLLVKCADQVVAGQMRWQTDHVTAKAASLGLRKVDRLEMLRYRRQPPGRAQVHARHTSTLLVFKADQ